MSKYLKNNKKHFILFTLSAILLCALGSVAPLLYARELIYISDGFLHNLLLTAVLFC